MMRDKIMDLNFLYPEKRFYRLAYPLLAISFFLFSAWGILTLFCLMIAQLLIQNRKKELMLQREIRDRKEVNKNLQLALTVLKHTSDAVVITDPNSIILHVNDVYCQVTGYERIELIGRSTKMHRSNHHGKAFYQNLWSELKQHGVWHGEMWDRRKNGQVYPKWLTIAAIYNEEGTPCNYVGIFSDTSQIKETEKQLEQLAFYDPLTKLPNRALFHDRLNYEINAASRFKKTLTLFFIDLDRFKYVNDTLGHHIGDELLIQVANRIQCCLRKSDTVARIGGDEFTVILPPSDKTQNIKTVAEKIIKTLKQPFLLKNREVFIGASIGIVVYPENGTSYEELTKNADTAMYQAKESGRGTYKFFTGRMNRKNEARLALEGDLRRAIELDELELYYQPKIEITTGKIVGTEALIRWNHPEKGMVSPVDFIPLAEETGLIVPIGEWILRTACRQLREWHDQGYESLKVAVNLSARQFQDPELVRKVKMIQERANLAVDCLELEITESIAMDDVDNTIKIIDELRSMGLNILIDDFGTGYSSLSYLKKLPLHALKIDQSFVRDLTFDSDDAAIVTSIIAMAKSMNLVVVAEGVETAEQLEFLKTRRCEEVQGYYFSKPLPVEKLELLLKNENERCSRQ